MTTRWRRQHVITLQYLIAGIFLGVLFTSLFIGGQQGHSGSPGQETGLVLWARTARRKARSEFVSRNGYDRDDSNAADDLVGKVAILCYVVLPAEHVPAKRKVYMQTWGRRCDHLILFTNRQVDDETIILDIPEPDHIEEDTKASFAALNYLYNHHLGHAQWFIRLHPMTYVVLENLRYFLRDENPNMAVYFGQNLRSENLVFPFGFGGYVLSRQALVEFGSRRGVVRACRPIHVPECVAIGECFKALGVRLGDSRDIEGRSRFHGISVESIAVHDYQSWFHEVDPYDNFTTQGVRSVSNYAITFSPVSDGVILAMEYYIYTARLYGRSRPSLEIIRRR